MVDIHVDHIGHPIPRQVPDLLADHRARQYLVGISHEVLEQRELFLREVDLSGSAMDRPGCGI
jgi:hypothetical protein